MLKFRYMASLSQKFPKSQRVRQRRDFDRIYKHGHVLQDDFFRVHYCLLEKLDTPGHLGLTVGKRLGKAVRRNRLKRLLREAFRQHPELSLGLELVVQPKTECATLENKIVKEQFLIFLVKLRQLAHNLDSRHL